MEPKIHCLLFNCRMFIIPAQFPNNKYIVYRLTYLRSPKKSLIVRKTYDASNGTSDAY